MQGPSHSGALAHLACPPACSGVQVFHKRQELLLTARQEELAWAPCRASPGPTEPELTAQDTGVGGLPPSWAGQRCAHHICPKPSGTACAPLNPLCPSGGTDHHH